MAKGLAIESSGKLILMAITIIIVSAGLFTYGQSGLKQILSFLGGSWALSGQDCPSIYIEENIDQETFYLLLKKASDFAVQRSIEADHAESFYTDACAIDVVVDGTLDPVKWYDEGGLDQSGKIGDFEKDESCELGTPVIEILLDSFVRWCPSEKSYLQSNNFRGDNAIVVRAMKVSTVLKKVSDIGQQIPHIYVWKLKDFCGLGSQKITSNTIRYGMTGSGYSSICDNPENQDLVKEGKLKIPQIAQDKLTENDLAKYVNNCYSLALPARASITATTGELRSLCFSQEFQFVPTTDITLRGIGKIIKDGAGIDYKQLEDKDANNDGIVNWKDSAQSSKTLLFSMNGNFQINLDTTVKKDGLYLVKFFVFNPSDILFGAKGVTMDIREVKPSDIVSAKCSGKPEIKFAEWRDEAGKTTDSISLNGKARAVFTLKNNLPNCKFNGLIRTQIKRDRGGWSDSTPYDTEDIVDLGPNEEKTFAIPADWSLVTFFGEKGNYHYDLLFNNIKYEGKDLEKDTNYVSDVLEVK